MTRSLFILIYIKFEKAILTIFLLPFIMTLILLKLKFVKIKSSKIGHLIIDTIFLKNFLKSQSSNKFIVIFEKNISNLFFYQSIKEDYKFKSFFLLNFLYQLLNKTYFKNSLIIRPERFEKYYENKRKSIIPNKKIFKFSQVTIENFFQLGLKEKTYFIIHNRDSNYLKKNNPKSFKNHDFRNFSIENLSKASSKFNKEYKAVRIGRFTDDDFCDEQIIDYSKSNFVSDELDIYLFKKCSFYIGSDSGTWSFAYLFDKPYSIINYRLYGHFYRFFRDNKYPSLLSRMYYKDSDKLLSFQEIKNKGFAYFTQNNEFKRNNLNFIENNESEIKNLIDEIIKIKKGYRISKEDDNLKKEFSKCYISQFTKLDYNEYFVNFGLEFIKKNIDLI